MTTSYLVVPLCVLQQRVGRIVDERDVVVDELRLPFQQFLDFIVEELVGVDHVTLVIVHRRGNSSTYVVRPGRQPRRPTQCGRCTTATRFQSRRVCRRQSFDQQKANDRRSLKTHTCCAFHACIVCDVSGRRQALVSSYWCFNVVVVACTLLFRWSFPCSLTRPRQRSRVENLRSLDEG